MSLLYREGDVAAAAARATLGLTPGNLDAHVRTLAAEGFVEPRRALGPEGFQARIRITRSGTEAFEGYLAALEAFARSMRVDAAVKGARTPE